MTNAVQIFNNPNFGNIRTLKGTNGKVLFCGKDIAEALGYEKPRNAIERHCKGALKRGVLTNGGEQEMTFIPEGDVYRLICNSKLPSAEKFEHWVFDEVLPAIRKTGGYVSPSFDKRLDIMDKNADTRRAKVMLDLMKAFKDRMTPESSQVFVVKCGELSTGQDMSDLLPNAKGKWYSATQIGDMFGVSANAIGRIAKDNALKCQEGQSNEYGTWKRSKSRYSSTEVLTWVYSDKALEWFKKYFEENGGDAK